MQSVVNTSLLGWPQKFGRKQALAVLLFLAAFLLLDRAVAWGLERALLASRFRYSELYRGAAQNDVLIFGNSRGVNGFYTPDLSRELNAPTLNLSFNGLSMGMSELLLLDYLERNPAPKLIILEITNLHNDGLNGEILQLYSSRSESLAAKWAEQESRLAWIQENIAQSHRFTGEFFLRVLYYLRRSDQNWINRYRINPEFAESFRPSAAMQAGWTGAIPEDRLATLIRIRDLCVSEGIALRLVITPYLPNYVTHLEGYAAWRRQVEKSSGMPVADWSQAVANVDYFADPLHMNLDGFRVLLPRIRGEIDSWLKPNS